MTTKAKKETQELKVPRENYYGTGRRKSSIAKVWLFPGSGNIQINGQTVKEYIRRDVLVDVVLRPLQELNIDTKYDAKISVLGGGLTGQAGAAQLGIARALIQMNQEFRPPLKSKSLLTRDARVKERKKYGRRKARKGPQYRKR